MRHIRVLLFHYQQHIWLFQISNPCANTEDLILGIIGVPGVCNDVITIVLRNLQAKFSRHMLSQNLHPIATDLDASLAHSGAMRSDEKCQSRDEDSPRCRWLIGLRFPRRYFMGPTNGLRPGWMPCQLTVSSIRTWLVWGAEAKGTPTNHDLIQIWGMMCLITLFYESLCLIRLNALTCT